jgi:large repetitive protein
MANFEYEFSVTGDCSNNGSGAIYISLSGGVEPYTIDWVDPNIGTGSTKTGLDAGVYIVRANDSLGDVNNEFYINIIVSSGGCLSVSSVSATTCGQNNGVISISGQSTAYPITINLYSGDTIVQSAVTTNGELSFVNLAPGVYRTYYEDYGGCSGYSESVIVNSSTSVDYGFFVVDDTNCFGPTGKLQITGLTGSVPFTYLWSDGSTGTTITGLTASTYSVTVSDSAGCSVTKSVEVETADPLQIVSFQTVSPSCFAADGSVNIIITGGTGPFFYSGTNGTTLISYATNLIFTGFTPGTAIFTVTDSALCSVTGSVYLQPNAGFSVLSINTQNSICSASGGTISVNVLGNGPFIYTLVKPDLSTESFTTNLTTQNYTDLDSGEYTVIISNTNGCVFTQDVTLFTNDKFSITTTLSATTCGQDNGSCFVQVGTGYTGVLDMILTKNNIPVIQYIDVPQSAVTFNGLSSGSYTLQVRDEDNCSVYQSFSISSSSSLDYGMESTSCGDSGSGGTITVSVFSGTPPFTYQWSDNVPIGQSGPSISNLTGGTFSVTVSDSSGCTLTRSVIVPCTPFIDGYQVVPVISSGFNTTVNNKRDFDTMVNEGFYDLTTGNTNCVLSAATYIATIEVSGNTYQQSFYTGTTLTDVPTESQWVDALEGILSGITGVASYTVNPQTNIIEVKSDCDGNTDPLSDSEFIVGLRIEYNIICES